MAYLYPFSNIDEASKLAVWNKGIIVAGNDPALFRQDMCGAWMKYSDHGNRDSQYGWEIDHIVPRALNGPTVINNVQPLNWRNNAAKGDKYPWACGM